jgi:hypothetical protein
MSYIQAPLGWEMGSDRMGTTNVLTFGVAINLGSGRSELEELSWQKNISAGLSMRF